MFRHYKPYDNWPELIQQAKMHPDLKDVTFQAWDRGDYGIGKENEKIVYLTPKELEKRREKNRQLIKASKRMLKVLSTSLADTAHIVALTDSEGWVLEITGNPGVFGGIETGIYVGSSWAPEHIGHSGVGIALCTQKPTLVYGIDSGAPHPLACCFGMPIHNKGKLVGIFNASFSFAYATPERLKLALSCAENIEMTLSKRQHYQDRVTKFERVFTTGGAYVAATLQTETQVAHIQGTIHNHAQDLEDQFFSLFMDEVGGAPETTAIDGLITEITDEFAPALEQQRIHLKLSLAPLTITTYNQLIYRALYNLCVYSITQMPSGGTLSISSWEEDGFNIKMTDTSPVPPNLPELLKPNPQETNSLYFADYIITQVLKGTLTLEDLEESGTTFHIKIPPHGNGS